MFSADPGNLDLGDLELTWLPASEHSPRLFTQSQINHRINHMKCGSLTEITHQKLVNILGNNCMEMYH
jgi:hypothetical protein